MIAGRGEPRPLTWVLVALCVAATLCSATGAAARPSAAAGVSPPWPICNPQHVTNPCVFSLGHYYGGPKTGKTFVPSLKGPKVLEEGVCPKSVGHGAIWCTTPFTFAVSGVPTVGRPTPPTYISDAREELTVAYNPSEFLTLVALGSKPPPAWCLAQTKSPQIACPSNLRSQPLRIWGIGRGAQPTMRFCVDGGSRDDGPPVVQVSYEACTQIQLEWGGKTKPPKTPKQRTSLVVAVTAPGTSGGLSVGDTASVTAKVTAKGGAVRAISLGKGLAASNAAAVVTARPGGLKGFALAKGASRSFTFRIKAAKPGKVTLSAQADGKATSGKAVKGSDSVAVRVGPATSAISIVTNPGKVALTVDDRGNVVAKQVAVKVTYTNRAKEAVNGVQLLSLNPEPADKTQALDQLAFPKGTFPIVVGTVAGGASVSKTLMLTVTGDGEYDLRALGLYADPSAPGGNGRLTAVGGNFEATVPLLYFAGKISPDDITEQNGVPFVKAGSAWYVTATIKNESAYRRLCVLPLVPKLSGNAAATGPVDITAPGSLRDIGAPFAGALAPGKKVSLAMFVDTSRDGATSGKASFSPVAARLGADEKCTSATAGGLQKLGAADLTIPQGGADFAVHVNVSQPLKDGTGIVVNTFNFFGGIGQNLLGDTFQQVLDVVALARSADSTPAEYKFLNSLLPTLPGAGYAAHSTVQAAQAVYTATEVYANYWRTASPAEKESVITQTASVLSRVGNDFWTNAKGSVVEDATPFMNNLEHAYATGDDAAVWHQWGQGFGTVLQQGVMLVFMDVVGAKLAKGPAALEKTATEAGADWEKTERALPANAPPDATLRTVPAGTLQDLASEERLWGIDEASDSEFARISKKYDMLIGARGRAPESVAKLKRGSVWKHENLKPKNVSPIDVQFLGFRESDLAEVRFRTYTEEQVAAIRSNVERAGLTENQLAAVLDRLQTRIDEAQYVPKIEAFAKKGQINVGFNYRDNGVNKATTRQIRKFDLLSSPVGAEGDIPAGGTYYTPYQENLEYYKLRKTGTLPPECKRLLASVLCTVTGDVDGVYLTTVDGGAVPPDILIKVYEELQKAGWQHPETLTWVNNQGQFFFGAKAKILGGLEQGGGEAMIEFAPDGGRRATYLNVKQSSLIGSDNYRISVVGGYTDLVKSR